MHSHAWARAPMTTEVDDARWLTRIFEFLFMIWAISPLSNHGRISRSPNAAYVSIT